MVLDHTRAWVQDQQSVIECVDCNNHRFDISQFHGAQAWDPMASSSKVETPTTQKWFKTQAPCIALESTR
jgi:hypothetical protein